MTEKFKILGKFIKDLSSETPDVETYLIVRDRIAKYQLGIDINSKPLKNHGDDIYEVNLMIKGSTTVKNEIMFLIEATYSGIFTIKNAPSDVLEKVLLIECPKFLFPFLRTIIANNTRDGGFPPLMITPIDFVGLYESKKKKN